MEEVEVDGGDAVQSLLAKWKNEVSRIFRYYLDRSAPYTFRRYATTKAFIVAFLMTFCSIFDVPVFWPVLLCYWIFLFVLTMKRQITHMIRYKYDPFRKKKYGSKSD